MNEPLVTPERADEMRAISNHLQEFAIRLRHAADDPTPERIQDLLWTFDAYADAVDRIDAITDDLDILLNEEQPMFTEGGQ